ncbi:MAG: UDP-glucose 4-epimerase GalE [Coriobacteriales bacterium]|jgi:UDP-glucose 4-epimerase|nr:UDP-glucose 4-epimerase GalE [Coriobacteriales bacterium]
MKVLVVGGAGYIGSHTVYELVRAGHEVVVLDNLSTGSAANVHPQAHFEWGDIRRKSDIARVLAAEAETGTPVDVVMHFAAKLIVPESVSEPLAYYENNVEGLRTLLEALVEGGVRSIVFSSTAAVYGEPTSSECHEGDATEPINPYGETKLACERMLKWAAAAYGLDYCILRYFNVAGADASLEIGLDKDRLTHLVPLLMQAALGIRDKLLVFGNDYATPDGTCIRDYVHVTDLARAHVLGAQHLLTNRASVLANLGSGRGFSVKEVVDAARDIFEVPFEYAPRRPGDPAKLIACIDHARETLGWEPEHDLHSILKSDYDFRRKLMLAHRPQAERRCGGTEG